MGVVTVVVFVFYIQSNQDNDYYTSPCIKVDADFTNRTLSNQAQIICIARYHWRQVIFYFFLSFVLTFKDYTAQALIFAKAALKTRLGLQL